MLLSQTKFHNVVDDKYIVFYKLPQKCNCVQTGDASLQLVNSELCLAFIAAYPWLEKMETTW